MLGQRLEGSAANALTRNRHRLSELSAKLDALSPLGILSRGYSVASNADGRVLSSVNDVAQNELITVRVSDGSIHTRVEGKERSK